MSILTQLDLETEFGADEIRQLTDRDGDGEADPEVVSQAILGAEAEILASLSGRVALPLPETLPLIASDKLRRIGADIARFLLYVHEPPEIVVRRQEMALQWLKEFAKGVHDLPGLTDAAGAPALGSAAHRAPDRVFSGETLGDY
jgi:phage gp36-like protein